jgi:hypothetical protein
VELGKNIGDLMYSVAESDHPHICMAYAQIESATLGTRSCQE